MAPVEDDHLPTGAAPLVQWTQVSGPGTITIADASLPQTTATASAEGAYILELSAFDGERLTQDYVEVRVNRTCLLEAPAGIVSWWRGELDGEDAIGENDARLVDVTIEAGLVGNGFQAPATGSGAHLEVPASPSTDIGTGDGFTFEMWGLLTSWNSTNTLVQYLDGTDETLLVTVSSVFSARRLNVSLTDTTGTTHVISSPANFFANLNEWIHLGVTYEKTSGVARIFRNGVQVQEQTLGTFTPDTTSELNLGGSPLTSRFLRGSLDEISLYDRALTPTEISDIHAQGHLGKCPPGPGQHRSASRARSQSRSPVA